MVTRRALLVLCVGAAALLTGGPADADGPIQIREVDAERFPEVTVTVSLQGSGSLAEPDLRVTENGVPVSLLDARPLGPSEGSVDVVLAIDTSNSMRGGPLETAFAAARSFVTSLPPWVHVGIVTFADRPSSVQQPSSDHAVVLAALATPLPTRMGTALYDAVVTAAGMFSRPGQRNIVLITDGRDTASRDDLPGAGAAAVAAGATIFSIGLTAADVDVPTLQELAGITSGAYLLVSDDDLDAVYRSLAEELSQQYLVSYRSQAAPGEQVSIAVVARDDRDTTIVRIPRSAVPADRGPSDLLFGLLEGPWAMAGVLVLSYLASFMLLSVLLGARAQARRDRDLAARMLVAATPAGPVAGADQPAKGWAPEAFVHMGAQIARAGGFEARLERALERAGVPIRTGEFVVGTALAGALGVIVGWLVFRGVLFPMVFAVVAGAIPSLLLALRIKRRSEQLHSQLPDILMVLASSLRAGHSFLQALDMVTKEIGEPAAPEFARVVTEIRIGRPVEEAMNAMAERVRSDDFEWAVLAINIQRQVGGNLAEILENVAETIRERETVRRQVRVLSAEGRLSVAILVALPFLVGLYMAKVNPGYLNELFSTGPGLLMLGGAALLMVVGLIWMRKVVNLDV